MANWNYVCILVSSLVPYNSDVMGHLHASGTTSLKFLFNLFSEIQ